MKKSPVVIRSLCAGLLALLTATGSARGETEPLAWLDFHTGQQSRLRVVGGQGRTVNFDHGRYLELSLGRASMPMTWPADMPNPGFPGVDPSRKSKPLDLPRLLLALDLPPTKDPRDLALVITVYDQSEGNASNSKVMLSWFKGRSGPPSGNAPPKGSTHFTVSGNPYASDVLNRPRLVRQTLAATGVVLAKAFAGGDLEIQSQGRVFLRRIEVYPLPPSPLDEQTSRRAPGMISYPRYRTPASVLDVWEKDLADLVVEQTKAGVARVAAEELLRVIRRHAEWAAGAGVNAGFVQELPKRMAELGALVEETALAMDRFYYEGKVALVQQDEARYRNLSRETRAAVQRLEQRAAEVEAEGTRWHQYLQTEQAKAVPGRKAQPIVYPAVEKLPESASPRDRVLFTAFANSPWDYHDPYNAAGRWMALLGIRTKGHLAGGVPIGADGRLEPKAWEHYRQEVQREQQCGFDFLPGVGHHGYHLCYVDFPAWLQQQSGQQPLYDVDSKGNVSTGRMDIWNPRVRKYFLDSLQALTANVAPDRRVQPWFYFGEPQCGQGYSAAARHAFREYLKRKYGEIAALNAAWKSRYGNFDQIAPPPPPGEQLRVKPSGLTYEFEKFRRDSFVRWWRDAGAAMRQGDPRARLWLEGWGRYDYLLQHGMDQLALFGTADISSVHTGAAQDCMRRWQLALSRYTGVMQDDGEIVICGPYYKGFASLEQLRAASEENVLLQCWYGNRLFMFWSNTILMNNVYSYDGAPLYNGSFVGPVSPPGTALHIVRRKADLYNSIVQNTSVVSPGVGILYSPTSFINSWPYNEVEHETLPLHAWLFHSDHSYFCIHEDAIVDGREDLRSFRVILAPWAIWLQPKAAQALLAWVKQGGVLISSGPVGALDPYGNPLNTLLEPALGPVEVAYAAHERAGDNRLSEDSRKRLRALGDEMTTHFGGWTWMIRPVKPRPETRVTLKLADGTPVVYEAPVGKGKLIVATGPLGKNGLRRFVMNDIEKKVSPLVRRSHDDGFHVLPRVDAQGNLFLGVFNQNVTETVTDTLWVEGRYPAATERTLFGDWAAPVRAGERRTGLTVTLAPGEGTVFALGVLPKHWRAPHNLPWSAASEPPLVASPGAEIASAEQELARRNVEPTILAEAQALLLAARRQASLGYPQRARRLATQALGTKKPPSFYSCPQDEVRAVRAARPVKIDGQIAEWRDIPRYDVKSRPDAGGQFAFQWDREHLYVLAVVRDADLKKVEEQGGDANWIWTYDGICLVLNPANTAPLTVGGALYDAKYRAAQTALLVSITGRKYANSPSGFSAAPVRSAVGEIEGGYVMEVAIPLKDVMIPPVAGANLGFEFKIVNNGAEIGFARFADRENWLLDPLLFARLRLVE